MTLSEHHAWVALAMAEGLIRRLQHELLIISGDRDNAFSDSLGSIRIDVAKLRNAPAVDAIAWIAGEQDRVSKLIGGDDIVENDVLAKVGWLLNDAKNALMER